MNKYKFENKNGEHLHMLWSERDECFQALTGTTTILEVLSKTLTYWASGLAVKEFSGIEDCKVLTKIKNKKATKEEIQGVNEVVDNWLSENKNLSVEEYIKLCQKAYSAHATNLKDTAEEGTDLHEELERFVKNQILTQGKAKDTTEYDKKIQPFIEWSKEKVKRFIGSEVYVYDEIMFTGGIVDCIAELTDGTNAIIDFKRAKDVYFSHFCQVGGYDLQLTKNGAYDENGNKLFDLDKPISTFIVIPFGKPVFEPVENNNIKGFQKSFLSLLNIYREKSLFENK